MVETRSKGDDIRFGWGLRGGGCENLVVAAAMAMDLNL